MIIDNIEKLDLLPDNERQLVISLLDEIKEINKFKKETAKEINKKQNTIKKSNMKKENTKI